MARAGWRLPRSPLGGRHASAFTSRTSWSRNMTSAGSCTQDRR